MLGRFRRRAATAVVYVFSVSLVFSSLIFAFILLYPVDVIGDWTIGIPKARYQLGDELVLSSTYTKNLNVSGTKDGAKRYIECKPRDAAPIRIELSRAEPNRRMGSGTTGIPVKIPTSIPSVTLPTQCKFTIIIDYRVFLFRDVREENSSREFTLYTTLPEERPATSAITPPAEGTVSEAITVPAVVSSLPPPVTEPTVTTPSQSDQNQPESSDPTVVDLLVIRPLQNLINTVSGLAQ